MSRSDRLSGRAADGPRNDLAVGTNPANSGADSSLPTSSPHAGRPPAHQPAARAGQDSAAAARPASPAGTTDGQGANLPSRTARSSRRAGQSSQSPHLLPPTPAHESGADGGRHGGRRIGRRQLAELRHQLSDRDLAILRSVGALHFVTTRQLERLHFHDGHATSLAAARACRHALARLHDLGLLDRLERRIGGVRAGSASFVYALSRPGSRLLGDSNRRRSREPSLAHLSHVLDVAELVVRLHERARNGDVELLSVETEPACWRSFLDPHQRQRLLKPDLRVTLGVGDRELHWFVEIDRGSEHRPALTRKVTSYLHAWQDGGEQARAGVFPRVLWVVPDEDRAEVIANVWESIDAVPEGMFLAATTERAVEALTAAGGQP